MSSYQKLINSLISIMVTICVPKHKTAKTLNSFILGVLFGLTISNLISLLTRKIELSENDTGDCDLILDGGYLKSPIGYLDEHKRYSVNTSIADELFKKVRILCWVMTAPWNHVKRARHVKATWGKRCNILLFMSTEKDEWLPAIELPVPEGRNNLWAKTKAAFTYVYENHREDADWFIKADDDTFVIMENLRFMLMAYKPSEPIYFGCRFRHFVKQGYMSGGAGYVLSGEAVRRFVQKAIPNKKLCSPSNDGDEDVEIGKCLEKVGVRAMKSQDSLGRSRFFPFPPNRHIIPSKAFLDWYTDYIYNIKKEGMEEISDIAISFHYVSPTKMYELEYLLYNLRPIGRVYQIDIPQITDKNKKVIT